MIEIMARSIVLSLAWFAGVNALTSALAAVVAVAIRRMDTMHRPRLLLSIRLFPAGASLLFVGAMFVPSHWVFEPRDVEETFGLVCYLGAVAGSLLLARSAVRAVSVAIGCRDFRFRRRASTGAGRIDVCEVEELPGVSLAGVLKPQIFIGSRVVEELSPPELDVAIAHEVAHRDAFDNLARWALICAPDLLAGSAMASRLEQGWREAAESRADARAAAGDMTRAMHLASALIKVARISSGWVGKRPAPCWSTLHDAALVEFRVRQLVSGQVPSAEPLPRVFRTLALCLAGLLVAVPLLAEPIHRVTETLVALLP